MSSMGFSLYFDTLLPSLEIRVNIGFILYICVEFGLEVLTKPSLKVNLEIFL